MNRDSSWWWVLFVGYLLGGALDPYPALHLLGMVVIVALWLRAERRERR